jgi:hypothetical protein
MVRGYMEVAASEGSAFMVLARDPKLIHTDEDELLARLDMARRAQEIGSLRTKTKMLVSAFAPNPNMMTLQATGTVTKAPKKKTRLEELERADTGSYAEAINNSLASGGVLPMPKIVLRGETPSEQTVQKPMPKIGFLPGETPLEAARRILKGQ